MEGAIGHLAPFQSTDSSSAPENKKRKSVGSSDLPSYSPPYVVLIRMPYYNWEGGYQEIDRWYTIKIPAEAVGCTEGSISQVWKESPKLLDHSSYAVLGSDLYSVGGRETGLDPPRTMLDLCWKRNFRDLDAPWISVAPMISPRSLAETVVLGGKIYVIPGYHSAYWGWPGRDFEVYDPMIGSWQALPKPPRALGCRLFSVALENPNRILLASLVKPPRKAKAKDKAADEDEDEEEDEEDEDEDADTDAYEFKGWFGNFFMYDVQNSTWKTLDPSPRRIHENCPLFSDSQNAVAAGNCLYWITKKSQLLAYDFELDLWQTGNLRGLNISFLGTPPPGIIHMEPGFPGFFHMENERFCILQSSLYNRDPSDNHILAVVFDVFPSPEKKNDFRISIVSFIKYRTSLITWVEDCLLIGK